MVGLRVLFCTSEYPPYGSGIANVVVNTRDKLVDRGVSVKVVAPQGGDVNLSGRIFLSLGQPRLALFWIKAIAYAVRTRSEYDVLWLQQPFIVRAGMLSAIGKPMILTWHATYHGLFLAHLKFRIWSLVPYYFVTSLIERRFLTKLTSLRARVKVTAVSSPAEEELRANGLGLEVKVIPNASRFIGQGRFSKAEARVQLERLYGIRVGEGDSVIISVGRVTVGKRPLEVLDLFKRLQEKRPNSILILVGRGSLLAAVRRKGNAMGSVYAPGFVPDEDLQTFYRAADLFISLSPHEAFNLTAVEASAFGLPVALSDIGSHRWLLTSGRVHGMIISPTTSIDEIVELLDQSSKEARREAPVGLSWDDIADSYLELIKSEVADPQSR